MTVDQSLQALIQWTNVLHNTAYECATQIRDALEPDAKLPEGCPSHASMAELILRDVKKRLVDVQGVVDDLEKAIWATERE